MTLRLLTWNVNHRTLKKQIPPRMGEAIASLSPDIVTLTEYVPGPSHEEFLAALASAGLSSSVISAVTPGQNHVLIVARSPLMAGNIRAPAISPAFPSNVLHVEVPDLGLGILGLRIPDYSDEPSLRRSCWDWIQSTAESVHRRPFVILGDLNTDPGYPRARCGDRFGQMESAGWQWARPSGSSYWAVKDGSGKRLDHAFVSGHYRIIGAEYITDRGPFIFAGKGRDAMSDHAVLLVDVERRSLSSFSGAS